MFYRSMALFFGIKFVVFAVFLLGLHPKPAQAELIRYEAAQFEQSLKHSEHVLVHVHADWCLTCAQQDPTLQSMAQDSAYQDLVIVRVDFDQDKDFLKTYKVVAQSTLIFFEDGREVNRLIGTTNPDDIKTAARDLLK